MTIGQLFTPVLASIMVMMCVLHVHTLHLERVLQDVLRLDEPTDGQSSPSPRSEGPGMAVGQEPQSVAAAIKAFAQVKQMLDKTSKRWAAVLAVEGGITLMIAAEPVLYAMTHAKGLDLDDSTETSEAGKNASLPLSVNASGVLWSVRCFLRGDDSFRVRAGRGLGRHLPYQRADRQHTWP